MAPLAPYVPDQFEMARRALVSAAQPDGAVHVATDPSVGSSPFLYGRAKPKTPLEQQMERERQRQLREQQRYDQLATELTFVPQWAADRMGPAATMEARRRGAETFSRVPAPPGTPMADAFARSEQDFANIPRAGAIAREEGDLDAEAQALRFFSPNQVIMRTRQQQEAAASPAGLQDQRFNLIRTLLQGAFSNPNMPPNWDQVSTILEMAGMSMPGVGGGGGNGATWDEVVQEAQRNGVSPESQAAAMEEAGVTVQRPGAAPAGAPAAATPAESPADFQSWLRGAAAGPSFEIPGAAPRPFGHAPAPQWPIVQPSGSTYRTGRGF